MHSQQSVAQMTHQIREQLRGKNSAHSHLSHHYAATTRRNGMGEEFRRVGQQLTSEMNKSKEDENKSTGAAVNSSMMTGNNTSQMSNTASS